MKIYDNFSIFEINRVFKNWNEASIHAQRKKILKEVIRILQEMPGDNPTKPASEQWLLDYANYTDNMKDLAKELSAQAETIVHTESLIGKKLKKSRFPFFSW